MQSEIRNQKSEIAITGLGLLTPLGHSPWENWRALCEGRCITDRCAKLPEDADLVTLVQNIGHVAVARHTSDDPAVELAERAARQAMIEAEVRDDEPMAMVIACSKGAMHYPTCTMPLGPVSYVVERLRRRLNIGPVRQVVAACASSLIGLHLARQWMLYEGVRRVLVVTAEAALVPQFIHSYQRLGVLPKTTTQLYRGLPLDQRRGGFVLTEVGAAMMLEREPKRRPLAYLADTAAASEAGDLVRLSPNRAALRHVAKRLFAGDAIDLLHPHATGTIDNDASELAAYADLLPTPDSRLPDTYACKGALGHGLGSAGLTAAVLAVLCAKMQTRPPMPWLEQPIDSPLRLHVESDRRVIHRQALFAAGFGGHVAGAIIAS